MFHLLVENSRGRLSLCYFYSFTSPHGHVKRAFASTSQSSKYLFFHLLIKRLQQSSLEQAEQSSLEYEEQVSNTDSVLKISVSVSVSVSVLLQLYEFKQVISHSLARLLFIFAFSCYAFPIFSASFSLRPVLHFKKRPATNANYIDSL